MAPLVPKQLSTKEVIKFLSAYTACDVSDALNQQGIVHGGLIPNLVNRSPVLNQASAVGKLTPFYTPSSPIPDPQ